MTASVDGTVRRWRIDDGQQIRFFRGHLGSVDELAWREHSSGFMTASRDGTLRIWEAQATSKHTVSFHIDAPGTYTTTFGPDGTDLYIAGFDGHVRVVNAVTGEVTREWEAHPRSSCNTLAMSHNGKQLVTCSWDKTARLWDTGTGERLTTFTASDGIYDCDISRDGRFIALCVGKDIEIWNTPSSEKIAVGHGHEQQIQEVTFSPDGQLVASAAQEKAVRLWETETAECVATLNAEAGPIGTVAFSPDGNVVACGGAGRVTLWDVPSRRLVRTYSIGDRSINHLAFTPDGRRLAVAADSLSILDPAQENVVTRLTPQNDDIYFLAFSPDGRRLATCTTSGSMVILEAEDEHAVTPPHPVVGLPANGRFVGSVAPWAAHPPRPLPRSTLPEREGEVNRGLQTTQKNCTTS